VINYKITSVLIRSKMTAWPKRSRL